MRYMPTLILFLFLGTSTSTLAHPGKVIHSFKAPFTCPTGLAFDGTNLWVTDHKADKLVCMNPKTGAVVKELASPGFWPLGLTWDGRYLWNIDQQQQKIFQVDPSDGTILRAIDAPGSSPEGLAWDGQTLWVSDAGADKIMKVDLSDGTAVQSFSAPAENPQGLTFDGTYLWCADRILDEIHMIDPQDGEVIIVMKSPRPYPRGLTWDGKYLWNVDYQADSLYQLVREDDELYTLENQRKARVTFTHEVKVYGQGQLQELNVYIAIPENLPQQQIQAQSFTPEDYRTITDRWNQAFAHFHYEDIQSEAAIQTIMTVEAEVSEINYFIFPHRCGTLKDVPRDIRKTYTANGSKYQIDDPYIQDLAKEIVGDETNPYWMARKIFDYVRNTVEYKLEGGWNVAPVVLKRGTGSCSEYT
ncbi:MAG: transglutaminase domain-containing protein, partial [Candidatus Neomarinimicrobiota bacterium]